MHSDERELQGALAAMDRESWGAYKRELRELERRFRSRSERLVRVSARTYLDDHGGHPLGRGMPLGAPFRADGESHRDGWMGVVRRDPCAFCGEAGGTVDHIEPKTLPVRGLGGAHCWLNFTGACLSCNGSKARVSMLEMLYRRRWGTGWSPKWLDGKRVV